MPVYKITGYTLQERIGYTPRGQSDPKPALIAGGALRACIFARKTADIKPAGNGVT